MVGWFKSNVGPIGMDIGAHSVKLLQLAYGNGRPYVVAAAKQRYPQPLAADPAGRREFLTQQLPQLLRNRRYGFRGRRVVTALGPEQLSVTSIRLPKMPAGELAAAVRFEAQQRLDFDLSDAQMQFMIAGEVRQGNELRDEVIIFAASAQIVEEHIAMLEQMKLEPVAIDAEPCAVFRSFERSLRRHDDENEVNVYVDAGMDDTQVIISRGRDIAFIKRIDVAGKDFDAAIAEHLELSHEEAASLRRRLAAGTHQQDDERETTLRQAVRDAIRPVLSELAQEVSLCLRYYAVSFRGRRPQRLTLTGGEAYEPTLAEMLSEQLGLHVQVGQPLRGVCTDSVDLGGDKRGLLAEWTVALGLALKGHHRRKRLLAAGSIGGVRQ